MRLAIQIRTIYLYLPSNHSEKNMRNSCDKPDRMFESVVGRPWVDIVDSPKLFEMTEPLKLGSVDDLVT